VNFESQLIFFFSALGAFNGFFLAIYFALTAEKKKFSNYFLALLLLTLSIRIIKSVFFYFNSQLANVFIQIGLSACILIGPFLYLYLKSHRQHKSANWGIHVLPFLIGITVLGAFYPYVEHRTIWSRWIVRGIYVQWLTYIILSFKFIKHPFQNLIKQKVKPSGIDIWLLSIFFGVSFICLAYNIGSYTSYIVGALSFSFVLYLIILLFIFRSNKSTSFFDEKEKYKNKEIETEMLGLIERKLSIVNDKELYRNPNLTLTDVAKELKIPAYTLSQFLNDNLGKSFSTFINEHRIKKAKELLRTNNNYTIESLGHESGFNSKSAFFTTFKKFTGQTPDEYRKTQKF